MFSKFPNKNTHIRPLTYAVRVFFVHARARLISGLPINIPQITPESLEYLNTAAKWAKFLAILGFILIGLMVMGGLAMGALLSMASSLPGFHEMPFPPIVFSIIYFALAAGYLMPVIYLNNFSNNITKAVMFRETMMMTIALQNIKRFFKYIGIFTIVLIASYFVVIIGVVIYAVMHVTHSM